MDILKKHSLRNQIHDVRHRTRREAPHPLNQKSKYNGRKNNLYFNLAMARGIMEL